MMPIKSFSHLFIRNSMALPASVEPKEDILTDEDDDVEEKDWLVRLAEDPVEAFKAQRSSPVSDWSAPKFGTSPSAGDYFKRAFLDPIINPTIAKDVEPYVIQGAAINGAFLSLLASLAISGPFALGWSALVSMFTFAIITSYISITEGAVGAIFRSIGYTTIEVNELINEQVNLIQGELEVDSVADALLEKPYSKPNPPKVAEREELERAADEARAKAEAEQKAIAEEEAEEERFAEMAAKAEAERIEQERLAAEKAEAERIEQEQLAAEKAEAERIEQEQLAAEKAEAERIEQERLAAEAEAERIKQERLAQEKERLEEEKRAREEEEALARFEARRVAEEHRLAEQRAAEEEQRLLEEQAAAAREAVRLMELDDEEEDFDEEDELSDEDYESSALLANELLGVSPAIGGDLMDELNDEFLQEEMNGLTEEEEDALGKAAREAVRKYEEEMRLKETQKKDIRTSWDDEMVSPTFQDDDAPSISSTEEEEPIDYSKMTVAQLKDLLRSKGMKVSGKKAELIERLKSS